MKKIFLSVAFIAVSSLSINAQEKQAATNSVATSAVASEMKVDARNDLGMSLDKIKETAYKLTQTLGLNENQVGDFYELLKMKSEILGNAEYSEERKVEFLRVFEDKVKASLDAKTYEKFRANKELYNSIVGDSRFTKK